MATMLDYKKIVDSIIAKTGKSEKDIKDMVSNKIERFAGLLTEEGAAFMVAKELGIDIEIEKSAERNFGVGELKSGLKDVCIIGRVINIGEIRSFEKGDRKGKYCKMVIADATGEATLTLWDKQIHMIDSEKICKGSAVFVEGCNVTEFKGNLALSLGSRGKIYNAEGKYDTSELPDVKISLVKLSDIKEPTKNVDLVVRVTKIFDRFEFEREGNKGKVLQFEVWDGKDKARAVAWHNLASKAQKLYVGELIKLEGADIKEGRTGLEIHLSARSRIIENPKTEIAIPEAYLVTGKEYTRKKINGLKDENYFVEILAEIIAIGKGKLIYDFCPECRGGSSSPICEKCGKKTKKRAVISLVIDDGSANVSCTMFGRVAENTIGLSTDELTELLEKNGVENTIKVLEEKIIGNFVLIHGATRKAIGQREGFEIIADDILPIDYKIEAERFYQVLSEVKS